MRTLRWSRPYGYWETKYRRYVIMANDTEPGLTVLGSDFVYFNLFHLISAIDAWYSESEQYE